MIYHAGILLASAVAESGLNFAKIDGRQQFVTFGRVVSSILIDVPQENINNRFIIAFIG